MSTICRLASRKLSPPLVCIYKPEYLTLARHVTLKAAPYQPSTEQDHDERNLQLKRPQSPHLSIYAIQLTSTLSITHRMTGAAVGGYIFLLAGGALVMPDQISHYIDALQNAHPGAVSLFTLKFLLAFPFSYHFCNGLRHLTWDLGKFLTMEGVNTTGYIMLGATTVMTLTLSLM